MGEALQLLTAAEVIEINRELTTQFGSRYVEEVDNLQNPDSLDYVLEAIQGLVFGVDLYPTIFQKAAILCWNIITHHTFIDGNKRAGMEACRMLLELNGYDMRIDDEVVDMALQIADINNPDTEKHLEFEEFAVWVEHRSPTLVY